MWPLFSSPNSSCLKSGVRGIRFLRCLPHYAIYASLRATLHDQYEMKEKKRKKTTFLRSVYKRKRKKRWLYCKQSYNPCGWFWALVTHNGLSRLGLNHKVAKFIYPRARPPDKINLDAVRNTCIFVNHEKNQRNQNVRTGIRPEEDL